MRSSEPQKPSPGTSIRRKAISAPSGIGSITSPSAGLGLKGVAPGAAATLDASNRVSSAIQHERVLLFTYRLRRIYTGCSISGYQRCQQSNQQGGNYGNKDMF